MKLLLFSILLLCFLLCLGHGAHTPRLARQAEIRHLPCKLVWKEYATGNGVLPVGAVASNVVEGEYVIRGRLNSTGGTTLVYGGRFNSGEDTAYIPYLQQPEGDDEGLASTIQSHVEVLTNRFGCKVSWGTEARLAAFRVNVDRSNEYVGRALVDGIWLSGHIGSDRTLLVADSESSLNEVAGGGVQYLSSYSNGIEMEIYNMQLDMDPFQGNTDFVGEDVIMNNGNAVINQTISHRKLIVETTTVTVSETWTSTYTETVKVNVIFFKKTKTTTRTVSQTKVTSVTTVEETDVEVSRQIIVPPYTALEACSMVSIVKDFKTGYSALAKYSAKGMSAVDVQGILEEDGIRGTYLENDYVVLGVRGEYEGALAMSTSFIVAPLGAPNGCGAAKKKSKQKVGGSFELVQ